MHHPYSTDEETEVPRDFCRQRVRWDQLWGWWGSRDFILAWILVLPLINDQGLRARLKPSCVFCIQRLKGGWSYPRNAGLRVVRVLALGGFSLGNIALVRAGLHLALLAFWTRFLGCSLLTDG